MTLVETAETTKGPTCSGLVFRFSRKTYFSTTTEYQKRYNRAGAIYFYDWPRTMYRNYETLFLLKSKSCPGCPTCNKIKDILSKTGFLNTFHCRDKSLYTIYLNPNNLLTLKELS